MTLEERKKQAAVDCAEVMNEYGPIEEAFLEGAEWMQKQLQAENKEALKHNSDE